MSERLRSEILDRIKRKPDEPYAVPFSEKKSITISGLMPHTYEFFKAEAEDKNMGLCAYMRELLELIESGEW